MAKSPHFISKYLPKKAPLPLLFLNLPQKIIKKRKFLQIFHNQTNNPFRLLFTNMNVVSLAVVCIVVSMATSTDATDPGCKSGFSAFKGHCYLAKIDKLSQQQALDKCHNLGADLASIHSEAEFDFVMGLLDKIDPKKTNRFWIGLKLTHNSETDKLINCHFTDGTPFDYGTCALSVGKKPWAYGPPKIASEPNNFKGKQNCVNIGHIAELKLMGYVDDVCDVVTDWQQIGYVCKN